MNGLTAVPGARLLRLQGNSTDGYWQLSPPATPSSTIRRKHQRFDANYFIAPARGLLNTIRAEARKLDSPPIRTRQHTDLHGPQWCPVGLQFESLCGPLKCSVVLPSTPHPQKPSYPID